MNIHSKRNRSAGIWLAGLCLLAAITPVRAEAAESTRPFNVLFIAVDDMNAEIASFGSKVAITPNIDKLAQQGTSFQRAYTQEAVCNPSRASVMTGMRPDTLRVWDLHTHFRDTHPDIVTLPQLFKQNGYFAQGIGKIYHNWHKQTFEGDPASWSVDQMYHWGTHFSDWYIPGKPIGTLAEEQNGPTQCVDVPDETYFDGRIAQEAIKSLNEHKDEPFFLAVGFWKPHLPFNAPKKYWDMYDPDTIPGPQPPVPPTDVPEVALHNSAELRGYAGMPKEDPFTAEQVKELRHGYYAAISFVDAQIGKVLNELARLDLTDNTIIVLWSDHGYHIGEHTLWCKNTNFERGTRVPLIVVVPGKAGGQQCYAIAELLDMFPTLTELCGLRIPDSLEGKSLAPLIDNPDSGTDRVALSQFPRPGFRNLPDGPEIMGYSLRNDRYRYTEWRDWKTGQPTATELYDHESDPAETVNLATHADQQSTIAELAGRLEQIAPRTTH
jgi:iduronate 2-sulfatase